MTFKRIFFPSLLFLAGLLIFLSAVFPIGFYWYFSWITRPPVLFDPEAVSPLPVPKVITELGIKDTDYTLASNWYPQTSSPSAIPFTGKYYKLSFPGLKIFDIPVEIDGADLKKNAVQFPGTALPGTLGNVVILGHSALPQFYSPKSPLTVFNPLLKLKIGDRINTNASGLEFTYQVVKISEVPPSDVGVLAQRYDKSEMTLITCVPLGTYWRRLIVKAELIN